MPSLGLSSNISFADLLFEAYGTANVVLASDFRVSFVGLALHQRLLSRLRLRLLLALLVWLLVTSHALACEVSRNMSVPKWDALEAVANRIPFYHGMITQRQVYAHYLWNTYKSTTRLQRPTVVNHISESLKEIAYRDIRLDMIGLILFGPEKSRAILRRRELHDAEGDEFSQCLKISTDLFRTHCGPLTNNGLRHAYSFHNICYYVKDMAMIEDAIIATCGLNNIALSVVDVENPIIDITPAPIHGSSAYCGRVSINGTSRLNLKRYAKSYQVMFEPFPRRLHNKVHICFHRNASRGLCQCEKDEWRSIQKGSRGSFMSPYEQKFVDVKFTSAANGYVTIILDEEVPLEVLRYVMLAAGACLLSLKGSKDVLNQNAAKSDRIGKWVKRVAGVIAILLSSFDTMSAMVALASCLALLYVISSIRDDSVAEWEQFTDGWTRDLVARWASTPGFHDWVIKNLNRITVLPDN